METIQDIQFELMRRASFNDFDGEYVVNLLKEHSNLWRGAIMERDDLIPLRDIGSDYWNVDTLYLSPVRGREEELEKLVRQNFRADEVDWLARIESGRVLRVWWD